MKLKTPVWLSSLLVSVFLAQILQAGTKASNPVVTPNGSGTLETYSTTGAIDVSTAFFQNLGTNGRTCNSCHVSSTAWTISPPEVQSRFKSTRGTDPIFRPVDGANCPSADVSTEQARQSAYSQLLSKGLIRISLSVPAGADFQIVSIGDPYACAQTTAAQPAFYRRPLPSTNLAFATTVMWDGRESPAGRPLHDNLISQATDATTGHAQAAVTPSAEQLEQMVQFESALYTAQATDNGAGQLAAGGASGGATNLSQQNFYVGINDALGGDPTGAPFDSKAFNVYQAWANASSPHRASVARGEALFNTLPIMITGVAGLNDLPGLGVINGSCTTCHDSPNVGNHSKPLAINIGVTDFPGRPGLDIAGLPVYTVQCANGHVVQTTDIGRAMITGKCTDVGKTKGPVLRGLASRAPYFHNGSAATLMDAVEFYNDRFNLSLTDQQKSDLVAFLQTL